MRNGSILLLALLATLPYVGANATQLTDAKVIQASAASGLENAVGQIASAAEKPLWIAWDVPAADPRSQMCCFQSIGDGEKHHWKGGSCSLTDGNSFFSSHSAGKPSTPIPDTDTFTIFLRAQNGKVDQLRTFSAGCHVDAAGSTVHRFTGVSASESVFYLTRLLDLIGAQPDSKSGREEERQHVIGAIASIRSTNAIPALTAVVRSRRPQEIRGQAAFWLGMRGGDEGRSVLLSLLDSPAAGRRTDGQRDGQLDDLMEQAVAGIAQDDSSAATAALLSLAKRNKAPAIRKRAIFWLGQKAGERATADLKEAAGDADEEVQEMAVFSISQLPKARAI
ncbi:MAG: HEAT repeat domain-containing protein, partial [Thermoanaerobaculia bacterium]